MESLHFVDTNTLRWTDQPDPMIEGPTEAIVHLLAATTCDLDRAIIGGAADLAEPGNSPRPHG